MEADYYTSERFIHDGLCKDVEKTIHVLYGAWKKRNCIEPFLLTWPAESVPDINGVPINDSCLLDLRDTPKTEWRSAILEAIQLSKAYALLLVEQTEDKLLAILESRHGTRSWSIPIQRRGDARVLGDATVRDDTDSLGYLWRPNLGRA